MAPTGARATRSASRVVRVRGLVARVLGSVAAGNASEILDFREVTCDGLAGQGLDHVVTEMHRIHAN